MTEPMASFGRLLWLVRAVVFGVVAVAVLSRSGSGSPAVAVTEVVLGAAGMAAWFHCTRVTPARAAAIRPVALIGLAGLGGFAAPSAHQTSLIALAIMGVLEGGLELSDLELAVQLLTGILAVEVGAVVYAHGGLGTILGYPAGFLGLAIVGRYRRTFRVQVQQAEALLAESERAQLASEQAAALTERSRIAREIHDVLAHSLGALGIQLQAAEAMLEDRGDVESALGVLKRARRITEEGMTETRRAVHALRADAPPLPEALTALLDGERLTVTGEPAALTPAAGLALLRVAQEAVHNARKHAPGHPPAITLEYLPDAVSLRVENALDLAGDRSPSDAAGGYGLAGMHERLRMIDGELTAGVQDGRWVVRATVRR